MSLRRIAAASLAVAALATVPALAATAKKTTTTTTTKTTTTTTTAAAPAGTAAGKKVFDTQCGICHSIDPAKPGAVGPHLNGVVDRKVASDSSFANYSKAMKSKSHKWTKGNLDIYLTDPQKFVPGTTMPISVPAAKDRADVIAFLATTK